LNKIEECFVKKYILYYKMPKIPGIPRKRKQFLPHEPAAEPVAAAAAAAPMYAGVTIIEHPGEVASPPRSPWSEGGPQFSPAAAEEETTPPAVSAKAMPPNAPQRLERQLCLEGPAFQAAIKPPPFLIRLGGLAGLQPSPVRGEPSAEIADLSPAPKRRRIEPRATAADLAELPLGGLRRTYAGCIGPCADLDALDMKNGHGSLGCRCKH